jgi:hypothetical protein
MNYWEIIADKLRASGWSWAVHLTLTRLVACFSRQMRTATMESDSSLVPTKSWQRFSNSKVSC